MLDRHSRPRSSLVLSLTRHVLAFITFWMMGFGFVWFGERVLGGWPATEVGQLFSCVLGGGIALRLRASVVAYCLAAMAAFTASELAIHLSYGIRAVQGAPTHFAVIGSGILGVALGALLTMRGRRTPSVAASATNGIGCDKAAAGADGAQAIKSERRSNLALQPTVAGALIARG